MPSPWISKPRIPRGGTHSWKVYFLMESLLIGGVLTSYWFEGEQLSEAPEMGNLVRPGSHDPLRTPLTSISYNFDVRKQVLK